MRKTLATAALVLALGCPAFAGEMHTPVATQPPPPAPQQATPGDMLTPRAALIDALLSLLAVALA